MLMEVDGHTQCIRTDGGGAVAGIRHKHPLLPGDEVARHWPPCYLALIELLVHLPGKQPQRPTVCPRLARGDATERVERLSCPPFAVRSVSSRARPPPRRVFNTTHTLD